MKKTLLITAVALGAVACRKDKTCIGRDKFGNQLFVTEGSEQCEKNINKANGEWCDCGDQTQQPPKTDSVKANN